MNTLTSIASACALLLGAGATAWADGPPAPDLGGMKFAVKGEFLYDPLGIGGPFDNCYTFFEDDTPDDGMTGGVWDDPAFPAPGTWVQHGDWGKIEYTAVADSGDGLTLAQNGTVKGRGVGKLEAYSVASLAGLGVIAVIRTAGQAVDECP